jgi:hypothetical protein
MSTSTSLAILFAIATLLPAVIHLAGQDETKVGSIITSICFDIIGAIKAAKEPKQSDDDEGG